MVDTLSRADMIMYDMDMVLSLPAAGLTLFLKYLDWKY